jgi:hypothetical protein
MVVLNQHWCEYTGRSIDEAYGQAWQAAIHPDDLPELRERWRSILASACARPRPLRAASSTGAVMAAPGVTSGNLAPGRASLAGLCRSMGRGVKVTGGQIDKAGLLQIGESGF